MCRRADSGRCERCTGDNQVAVKDPHKNYSRRCHDSGNGRWSSRASRSLHYVEAAIIYLQVAAQLLSFKAFKSRKHRLELSHGGQLCELSAKRRRFDSGICKTEPASMQLANPANKAPDKEANASLRKESANVISLEDGSCHFRQNIVSGCRASRQLEVVNTVRHSAADQHQ